MPRRGLHSSGPPSTKYPLPRLGQSSDGGREPGYLFPPPRTGRAAFPHPAPTSDSDGKTLRPSVRAPVSRHCVRRVRCWLAFSSAPALRSIASAAGSPGLFGDFCSATNRMRGRIGSLSRAGSTPRSCSAVSASWPWRRGLPPLRRARHRTAAPGARYRDRSGSLVRDGDGAPESTRTRRPPRDRSQRPRGECARPSSRRIAGGSTACARARHGFTLDFPP